MRALDLITELKNERADLLHQLAEAEQRAHQAARTMYRRGYLAGHSAGRKGATPRGPYSRTRQLTGDGNR